jgi:hypothetical protein
MENVSEQQLARRRLVFGRRRSLTKGQTKKERLFIQRLFWIYPEFHLIFVPSASIRAFAKIPKRSRQFSQINNKNAAQCHSFLLQQSTKPRFHVVSPTRLSFFAIPLPPTQRSFRGTRISVPDPSP